MVGEGLIQGVKDIGKEVIPPVHNSLGRYVIWPTVIGTTEAAVGIGLGAVDLARNVLEYGVVRPFVAYPIKLAARGFIEMYTKLDNTTVRFNRGLPVFQRRAAPRLGPIPIMNPRHKFFPRIGFENIWQYGIQDGTPVQYPGLAGGGNHFARPDWLRRWSLSFDYREDRRCPQVWSWLYHADGPGKYIRPKNIPKWYVHDWQHPDVFDRTKISEPRAHSPQWYQDYLDCLTQEAAAMVNDEIKYHLTPRINGEGTHYIDRNGQNPIPIGDALPTVNDIITRMKAAKLTSTPDNERDALDLYYPNYRVRELLTSNNEKEQSVGYGYIFKKIKTIAATEHIQIHEHRKWNLFQKKLAPKIERARIYAHFWESLFRGVSTARKDTFTFEDLLFEVLKAVPRV